MRGGDDEVSVPIGAFNALLVLGEGGNDTFDGNAFRELRDVVYGGSGHDKLSGGGGDDILLGGIGRDVLLGGNGIDFLYSSEYNQFNDNAKEISTGGYGPDILFGDSESDVFIYAKSGSLSTNGGADTINNFDYKNYFLNTPVKGTAINYLERGFATNSMDCARNYAEKISGVSDYHVFVYNSRSDTGYLLSDLDRNGNFETGVVMKGAGSASDLNWSDII